MRLEFEKNNSFNLNAQDYKPRAKAEGFVEIYPFNKKVLEEKNKTPQQFMAQPNFAMKPFSECPEQFNLKAQEYNPQLMPPSKQEQLLQTSFDQSQTQTLLVSN